MKWLLALLLTLGTPGPVKLIVYPLTQLSASATIQLTIFITRHADNRSLCFGYTSEDGGERRSCEDWNGEAAPASKQQRYTGIPTGSYVAFVELYRLSSSGVTRVPFSVLGIEP